MEAESAVECTYTVTLEEIVRYAGASGDFTAIHYDAKALSSAGYEEFFSMGMLVAGRLGTLVASTYGDEAVRQFNVRFTTPSWVGRTVTCRVTPSTASHSGSQLELDLEATDDSGERVAVGRALVIPRPR